MASRLFMPTARQTNWLLAAGFLALGYALYLRYLGIEQTLVGLACDGGLNTWLCLSRRVSAALFEHQVFGIVALVLALLNLARPTLLIFGAGIVVTALGVVLYNAGLCGLAAGLLMLSLARRAPEAE
ncbi:MAG TPA: hypothetical protein VHA55_04655 [Pseudorhodoplanes sp.]|jgi:hypothetical protein|nr:hypothetical protein [Pseudorhodoplanes sp.]